MRVFLVIAGCLLALTLMAAAAGYWWWQQNGDALVQSARDGVRDGTAQGEAGSDQECYDASLAKLQRCGEFRCGVYNQAFAAACLANASVEDGLCDAVPRDPGVVESMRWVNNECAAIAGEPSACQSLKQLVLEHCRSDDD